jgi:hypothetical protein
MRAVARSPAFVRFESFAHSRAALAAMGIWAVAEALAWPVIPDFLIFPLALAAPRLSNRTSHVCIASSESDPRTELAHLASEGKLIKTSPQRGNGD